MQAVDVTPVKIEKNPIQASEFCDALKRRDLQQYQRLVDHVVDYHLVFQAAQREGINATDEELQSGADQIRRANGLVSAADTHAWLDYKSLSVDDLEKNVEFWALSRKLITQEFGADACKDYFNSHEHRYARAALSTIVVDTKEKADDLCEQIRSGASFQELAREFSQDASTGSAGGMLGWLTVGKLPEPLQRPILNSAGRGEVLDPVESGGVWHIVQVAAVSKPEYSPEHDQLILPDLLSEWLRKERGRVSIQYSH